MKALDLFCKAGGASRGLADAGFEVTGVDIEPQKRYPYKFIQADVMEITVDFFRQFDFIWASPPCQRHSTMTKRWGKQGDHPDLIEPARKRLIASGVPYVIENVIGAPLMKPVTLCGSMFGLQTKNYNQLRRHRLFETSFRVHQPRCVHSKLRTIGVYGNAGGRSKRDGITFFSTQDRRDAMGIQWMTGKELSQAIPPAYAKYIAKEFLKSV